MPSRRSTRGFSLIELLIVVAILLVIAAIAIPSFLRSRIRANESATVANIRTINSALAAYSSVYADCGYPDSLTRLGPGTPPSSAAAGLLDAIMANDVFVKSGYQITYVLTDGAGDCTGPPGSDYNIKGNPAVPNRTGINGFFTDSSNVIRADPDGDADINSPGL